MRNARGFLAVFGMTVLLVASPSRSFAQLADADRALIIEALTLDRTEEVLRNLQRQTEAGMDERLATDPRASSLTPEQRQELKQKIVAAYDPKLLLEDIVEELARSYDRKSYEAYVAANSRPIARRMTDLSFEAERPADAAAKAEFIRGLASKSPEPERVAQLMRLDEHTNASMALAELNVDFLARMGGLSKDDPQYSQLLERARAQTRESLLASWLFAFRGASLRDITDYVVLYEDRAVAKVGQGIVRATARAMMQGSMRRLMMNVTSPDGAPPAGTPGSTARP